MIAELNVGDYITAADCEGSVGIILALYKTGRVRIKWLTPQHLVNQNYIAEYWLDDWCRVLSEPEVTLLLLTANEEESHA